MLRVCITAVSLLAVLAHVTLGCCLHHAHAAEPSPPAQACSAGHYHHGDSSHHDRDGCPLPPHDDCHEAHCFLALVAKTAAPDHSDLAIDLVHLVSGEEVARTAAATAMGDLLADASRPLPLRAHLRYCVLLN